MKIDRTCHRTTLALPWLLNGSLPEAERREVREHLIGCPACRAELARTREALATFRAARGTSASEAAPVRLEGARRPAAWGRPALHRLAWAAMIAGVLASAAGVWRASTTEDRTAQAERVPVRALTRPPAPAAQPEALSANGFEGGSLGPFQVASLPAEPQAVPRKPSRSARHTAARSEARTVTISALDFESGDLQWK